MQFFFHSSLPPPSQCVSTPVIEHLFLFCGGDWDAYLLYSLQAPIKPSQTSTTTVSILWMTVVPPGSSRPKSFMNFNKWFWWWDNAVKKYTYVRSTYFRLLNLKHIGLKIFNPRHVYVTKRFKTLFHML